MSKHVIIDSAILRAVVGKNICRREFHFPVLFAKQSRQTNREVQSTSRVELTQSAARSEIRKSKRIRHEEAGGSQTRLFK